MSEGTVSLVVTTLDSRQEVSVPLAFLDEGQRERLYGFLRESSVVVPRAPMLTRNESGYILHETPEFG